MRLVLLCFEHKLLSGVGGRFFSLGHSWEFMIAAQVNSCLKRLTAHRYYHAVTDYAVDPLLCIFFHWVFLFAFGFVFFSVLIPTHRFCPFVS